MQTFTLSKLLPLIEDHLQVTGTDAAALGLAAVNDARIVSRMRLGVGPKMADCHRLLDHMTGQLEELIAANDQRQYARLWAEYDGSLEDARLTVRVDLISGSVTPVRISALSGAVQVGQCA